MQISIKMHLLQIAVAFVVLDESIWIPPSQKRTLGLNPFVSRSELQNLKKYRKNLSVSKAFQQSKLQPKL